MSHVASDILKYSNIQFTSAFEALNLEITYICVVIYALLFE